MPATTDWSQDCQRAQLACRQGHYEQAAAIVERLVEDFPENPGAHLMRGHIYCYGLQQYELAKQEYELVLRLTKKYDLINLAKNGLTDAIQLQTAAAQASAEAAPQADMPGSPPIAGDRSTPPEQPAPIRPNLDVPPPGTPPVGAGELKPAALAFDSAETFPTQAEVCCSTGLMATPQPNRATSSFEPVGPILAPLAFDENLQAENQQSNGNAADDPFQAANATTGTSDCQKNSLCAGQSIDFLDEFEDFDDLGEIPDFYISEDSPGFSDITDGSLIPEREIASSAGVSEPVPDFAPVDSAAVKLTVTQDEGWRAFFENAPLATKQVWAALITGAVSALAAAAVSSTAASYPIWPLKNAAVAASAGLAAGLSAFAMGQLTTQHIQRATQELEAQLDAVVQGNLSALTTVHSKDEFGILGAKFNQMARQMFTITVEAHRKAHELEQANKDLERMLLDALQVVEKAARLDLTVQAVLICDVLGCIADSFDLTVQNLREMVIQVKQAARQINRGASDSDMLTRRWSEEARKQAEEIAATVDSVQFMTVAIERVAASATEVEEMALSVSATATAGGEAVEQTVAALVTIGENIAEITQKVKGLAEFSQEIFPIVAEISTIAERTNFLALNACMEAAGAGGEAGQVLAAFVAGAVRQMADLAAGDIKEIEQIVMQIQSETGSVMLAMEEGTLQVMEGTKLAEGAKRAVGEIMQMANGMEVLASSIAASAGEKTETCRAVAQVMSAVELRAQETSQEQARVSGDLQIWWVWRETC
jgi:twitching motility protein PilJ